MDDLKILQNKGIQKRIALGDLIPSSMNTFKATDIDELEESLRFYGLMVPISVAERKEGYEILSGYRRYLALRQMCKNNGMSEEEISAYEVPCVIIADKSISDAIKSLVIELSNLETREIPEQDLFEHRLRVVKLYHELCDCGEIKSEEIQRHIRKALSISARYARMYNSIFENGDDSVIAAVQSNNKTADPETDTHAHIPISAASRLMDLPKEEQKKIINRVDAGRDINDILNVKSYKDSVSSASKPKKFESPDWDEAEDYGNDYNPYENAFDDFDIDNASLDECLEYLDEHQIDLDANIDTTDRIRELRRDDGRSIYDKERAKVKEWNERIDRITDPSKLQDADKEVIEELLDSVDHWRELIES